MNVILINGKTPENSSRGLGRLAESGPKLEGQFEVDFETEEILKSRGYGNIASRCHLTQEAVKPGPSEGPGSFLPENPLCHLRHLEPMA